MNTAINKRQLVDSVELAPISLKLRRRSQLLEIAWQDGQTSNIGFSDLKKFCACSQCRARKLVGVLKIGESIDIDSIKLMGSTGIQVIFSDGHDKGIFPWIYLRAIAHGEAMQHLRSKTSI